MTASNLVPIDFITHNEVLIDAAPAEVWPYVLDTDGWHRTMLMVPVGGARGEVGERFHAVPREQAGVVAFHVENVELDPARRRTIRLESTEGAFMGFSTWALVERAGATALTYDVFSYYEVPAEYVDALRSSGQTYMDEGLAALKALVEAR